MKPKLELKNSNFGFPPAKKLTVTADSIAWIRELASSICLIPPEDDASSAEFKQYAWNSAICLAIVEIADNLLSGERKKNDNHGFPRTGPNPDLTVS